MGLGLAMCVCGFERAAHGRLEEACREFRPVPEPEDTEKCSWCYRPLGGDYSLICPRARIRPSVVDCLLLSLERERITRVALTTSLLELVRRREREANNHHGEQWMNGSDGRYARARAVLQKIGAL
jgi:hypothetical protein